MNFTLKKTALENGYGEDLANFLDVLERNQELWHYGANYVEKNLKQKTPDDEIIKIALANRGNIIGPCIGGPKPNDFEKDLKKGQEEYEKHLNEDGSFLFSDFKIHDHKIKKGWNDPFFGNDFGILKRQDEEKD